MSDLSQTHLLILDRLHGRTAEEGRCHILNCGYGKGYSVREVLQAVQAEAGVAFPIDEGPRRAGDSPALIADAARLAGSWGWQPRFADLRQMVRHALASVPSGRDGLRWPSMVRIIPPRMGPVCAMTCT